MKTLKVIYEGQILATVEFDPEKAADPIKGMVEFWSDWEADLALADGDHYTVWMANLGRFIFRNHRSPEGDEGWCSLNGEYGITLKAWEPWEPWEPDEGCFEVE